MSFSRLTLTCAPGGYRLFLALLVFAAHCSSLALGRFAVFSFFILSGYWVQRMWVSRYAHTRLPYLTFVASRAWRLLPSFILIGGLTIALLPAVGVPWSSFTRDPPWRVVTANLFTLGYADLHFQPMVPAWSLDIEMRYYLLAPVLAVAARRWHALGLLTLAGVVSLVATLSVSGSGTLLHYVFFFVVGLAAAALDWRPTARLAAWAGSAAVVLSIAAAAMLPGVLFGGRTPGPMFSWNEPANAVLALVAAPFGLFTVRQGSGAGDRAMADLSYIVYLLHWIAVLWLGTFHGDRLHRLLPAAVAWSAVLGVAWIIWRWFDQPINAMRARWVAARTCAGPSAVMREASAP